MYNLSEKHEVLPVFASSHIIQVVIQFLLVTHDFCFYNQFSCHTSKNKEKFLIFGCLATKKCTGRAIAFAMVAREAQLFFRIFKSRNIIKKIYNLYY